MSDDNEISWDDVDTSAYRNTDSISDPVRVERDVRQRSTDHYEASWLEWFSVDRKVDGQYGACSHCRFTLMVRFASNNDGGALGRCRLGMERHVMATHITPSLVKKLSATYVQPVDPPF